MHYSRPKLEVETTAHIEGNLDAEVSMIVLDALELIVQVIYNCFRKAYLQVNNFLVISFYQGQYRFQILMFILYPYIC